MGSGLSKLALTATTGEQPYSMCPVLGSACALGATAYGGYRWRDIVLRPRYIIRRAS